MFPDGSLAGLATAILVLGILAYLVRKNGLVLIATSLFLGGASLNLIVLVANGYMPTPGHPGRLWYLGDFYTPWLFSIGDLTTFCGAITIGIALCRKQ